MGDADRLWSDSMPDAYERWLVPTTFRPFAAPMARRVAAHAPARVLEIAAGTGVLTRELLEAGVRDVVATDLNDAMVERGRRAVPEATWQQADALALPFGDGEFDAVVCQFGVMFFPDRRAGYAEVRRVLAPHGRFLATTWGPIERHDFETPVQAALVRAFPQDPPTFLATLPHGYTDPQLIRSDLEAVGLRCLALEEITVEGAAASAADLARGYCTGTPLRAAIEARGGDLESTITAVTQALEHRLGAGPVTGQMAALVMEAVPAASDGASGPVATLPA